MDYRIAYAISFASGILLSYLINTRFVFREQHSLRKLLLFPLVYLVTYLAGAIVLHTAVSGFGINKTIAPLLSICATLPLSYVLTKLVLSAKRANPRA